jgi:hypothetical protein
VNQRQAQQAAALEQLKPFAESECYEQVVAVIKALPVEVAATAEIDAVRTSAQDGWKREWTQFEMLGQVYAALESCEVEKIAYDGVRAGDSAALQGVYHAFAGRRAAAVDQVLMQQMHRVQTAKAAGAESVPVETFDETRKLAPFASEAVRRQWSLLADPSSDKKDKFLARLGRRGK